MNQENNNENKVREIPKFEPVKEQEEIIEEPVATQNVEVEQVQEVEPEVTNNQAEPKDLEAFFKEHRNNGEHYEVRKFGGLIVFLALIAVVLGGYIIFDKFLRIEEPTNNNQNEGNNLNKPEETKEANDFTYDNYDLKLPKEIDSVTDIYAIYVKTEDYKNYEIYGKYTSEKEVLIANVNCKDLIALDYRILDVNDSKLYYVIHSKEKGNVFEVNYIDLNDLSLGAKKLDDFNEIYKKENLYTVAGEDTYYSSQIYVKDDDIFYTSYKEKSLKKYNVKTKTNKKLFDNITWTDYFVDKRNNYIFYLNKNTKLYLTDLNGNNPVNLKTAQYGGSDFWLKAYYNNKPAFGFENGSQDYIDIYIYDYSRNEFLKVQESANRYNIQYNNIDMKATSDEKIVGFLYIA